jgi:3-hydroxyisobutyrate dehydrogenase-like beta-hydroxyacid dehydrogenase
MGCAVGAALKSGGLNVIACLTGRSPLTRERAERAGFQDVPSINDLLGEADLVLSIVPPASALGIAREVASAMKSSGHTPPYAECNAISPNSTCLAGEAISGAGADYIDAGIVGPPPGEGKPPRFYVSGERAELMTALDGMGIDIRPIGNEIGRASGLKRCYASLTKGTLALQTAVLITAEALGLTGELQKELLSSREAVYRQIESGAQRLPSVSARYLGEMEEIAATYSAAGVTPKFHQGALDVYRLLARTPLASETPDTIDTSRTLEEVAKVFVKHLPMR